MTSKRENCEHFFFCALQRQSTNTKYKYDAHHDRPDPQSFASDNNAGVHPEIIDAMRAVNEGHVIAYGDDDITARAVKHFKKHFGKDVEVYFVFGGTGANTLGLKAITKPYQAIVCAETAHINVDECGAPEKFTGCKLIDMPTPDGKLRLEQLEPLLHVFGNEHHVQPRVVSISQATEMGTVYTKQELKAIAEFAHANNMLLHVDGARLANAAASLDASLKSITADVGVDVLSFGGAKNGMMYGEAVVFFRSAGGPRLQIHSQAGHAPAVEDAVHLRAIRDAVVGRSMASQRRAREPHGALAGE